MSGPGGELAELRDRVEALESENTELKRATGTRAGNRARSVLAAILIVVAALLAPAAVVSTWVRAELIDTDRFVSGLAPLAEKPAVQSFISDEVVDAIEESLDIEAVVHDAVSGLSALDLPPQAAAAFTMLEGPAVHGIQSILRTTVDRMVTSPQFAQIWEVALRQTHARAIAVIQGDPNSALQLSDDGTVTVELGTIIAEAKTMLQAQGVDLASLIPEIDRSIPLVTSDSLTSVRTAYTFATAVGYWLPWLVLGLLVAAIAIARKRARATLAAGIGLAASFLLLIAGIGTGKLFFVATVSPAFIPVATAEALFGQVTLNIHAILVALTVLSALIAVAAWLFGSSRQARAIRSAANRGFDRARAGLDRLHLNTGAVGSWIDRIRPMIWSVAVAAIVLVVFLNRPISLASVLAALGWFLATLLLVELLRRPQAEVIEKAGATQQIS
ncbi:hypothetical protein [Leucobacter aridicollis]|uniref:hypothetical protein n=1 Tax=Leucobacter aridicollis TaxID=283878 RepID=UPI002103F8AB|nr:hypothetical protein [Leucobacter aridicollis]UTX52400.1 hypothetical protein KI794_11655 [Leucobacter aridicollis]